MRRHRAHPRLQPSWRPSDSISNAVMPVRSGDGTKMVVRGGRPRSGAGKARLQGKPERSGCRGHGRGKWLSGREKKAWGEAGMGGRFGGGKGASRSRSDAQGRSSLETTTCARSRSPCPLRLAVRGDCFRVIRERFNWALARSDRVRCPTSQPRRDFLRLEAVLRPTGQFSSERVPGRPSM